MDTPLDLLAAQVRVHPPLAEARVEELLDEVRRAPGGGAAAVLIEHHLGIALDSAIAHRDHHVDVVDLFQEGAAAMVAGVAAYAASDGAAAGLAAHLRRAVELRLDEVAAGADDHAAAEEAVVRDTRLLEAAEVALRARLGREPALAEVAALLEWNEERAGTLLSMLADARRRHDLTLLPFLDDEDDDDPGDGDGEGSR